MVGEQAQVDGAADATTISHGGGASGVTSEARAVGSVEARRQTRLLAYGDLGIALSHARGAMQAESGRSYVSSQR